MSRSHYVLVTLLALSVAGCGRAPESIGASRHQNFLLDAPVADAFWQETQLTKDAIALEDMIREMTAAARKGEPAKCDGTSLSDPSFAGCSESQLKGRLLGALPFGSKEVDSDSLSPAMADVFTQLEAVDDGIDQLLIAQRAETVRLRQEMTQGVITEQVFNARLAEMADNRRTVADTLALGTDRAAKARLMLTRAQGKGQDGLSWYVASMKQVEETTRAGQARLMAAEG
ncbi:hypothetical protein [Tropicibacter naphthalenivorans]|uniref:Uncharacterized protein n=1 Tax=Tropicibacter naphthalenivorans TaxID=441103 RepID=A0A0P1GDU2_9RHOB|nr:hypothetical protein [Tropicibacter naphthalenivorans]CUH79522.1 hypothetical protein TRN7648_02516 [Tropicibacter naphthalenivorans]SMC73312.1 hypothetical protein SAMN04488093_103145 [Tropicibacter naphthalenivorans]